MESDDDSELFDVSANSDSEFEDDLYGGFGYVYMGDNEGKYCKGSPTADWVFFCSNWPFFLEIIEANYAIKELKLYLLWVWHYHFERLLDQWTAANGGHLSIWVKIWRRLSSKQQVNYQVEAQLD